MMLEKDDGNALRGGLTSDFRMNEVFGFHWTLKYVVHAKNRDDKVDDRCNIRIRLLIGTIVYIFEIQIVNQRKPNYFLLGERERTILH